MNIAYFDCFCGAAGDMIAAAMLDAGLDEEYLLSELKSLGIEGLEITIEPAVRSGIAAMSFKPHAPEQNAHRHLADITRMITQSGMSNKAKYDAIEVFKILADAEAKVHGTSADKVHFHEVGAVDSIVDIVTACIGFDALKIDRVICSSLSVGSGTVNTDHGIMPVPAPATAEILKKTGAPIIGGPVQKELLTPTAAAIFAHFVNDYAPLPPMAVKKTGYGAGTMEFKSVPNVLRLIIGTQAARGDSDMDSICLIEANVDDITGELAGYFVDKLFCLGALDAYTTSIQMKKNRPAVKISAICPHDKAAVIENSFFEEGVSLGIRKQILERQTLRRKVVSVSTKYGEINIKTAGPDAEIFSIKPEFADCQKAAKQSGVSVSKVRQEAIEKYMLRKNGGTERP